MLYLCEEGGRIRYADNVRKSKDVVYMLCKERLFGCG